MEEKEKEFNNKEFKQTRLIIVLVAIIVILVFAIGFLLGAKQKDKPLRQNNEKIEEKKESKKEEKKKEKEEKDDYISISKDDSLVNEALSLIPRGFCGGVYFDFEKDLITVDDLTSKYKANMLVEHYKGKLIELLMDDKGLLVSENDLKRYFEDVSFLNDERIGEGNFEKREDGYYLKLGAFGCEGPLRGEAASIDFKEAKKDENELQVEIYYLYYDTEVGDETDELKTYTTLYKDSSKKEVVTPKFDSTNMTEGYFSKVDKEKLDTYTLYFDISNSNMRFEKMVKNDK